MTAGGGGDIGGEGGPSPNIDPYINMSSVAGALGSGALGSGAGIDPYINMSSVAGALQDPAGSFWGSSTGSGAGLGSFVTPGAISQGFQDPGQWSNSSLGMGSSDLNALTGLNLAPNYDFTTTSVEDYGDFVGSSPETGPFGGTWWPRIKAGIKNKLENFKDPKKRSDWFKRFFGNLLRFHPQTRLPMLAADAFKAFQEGGAGGILGALGQMGMQKVFGKNLDVARGIFGAASGLMTSGQALGNVAMSRGMRAGIQGLMKNIYGQWGMNGVQIAMPLLQTALQGKGKGPGGP